MTKTTLWPLEHSMAANANRPAGTASGSRSCRRAGWFSSPWLAALAWLWLACGLPAFAAVLVNDPFTDASRTNLTGGDTWGMVYYASSSTAGWLTVTNDPVLGSGNALRFAPTTTFARFIGHFGPIQPLNPDHASREKPANPLALVLTSANEYDPLDCNLFNQHAAGSTCLDHPNPTRLPQRFYRVKLGL